MEKKLLIDNGEIAFTVVDKSASEITLEIEQKRYRFSMDQFGQLVEVDSGEKLRALKYVDSENAHHIQANDLQVRVTNLVQKRQGQDEQGPHLAPMPGKVLKVFVGPGDEVARGDALLILEAMKMEHSVLANFDGEVVAVHCKEGEQVKGEVELVEVKKC